jgi:hypothetical protein
MNGAPSRQIRKDDLEALGDLVEYVGGGLSEVVQATTPGDRRNLFKNGNPDPRVVFSKALGKDGKPLPPQRMSAPMQIPMQEQPPPLPQRPPQQTPEPEIPRSALPLTNEQLAALMQEVDMQPEEMDVAEKQAYIQSQNISKPISPRFIKEFQDKPTSEQLEFNFVHQIIQKYGTVGDVIKHFDERFDEVEKSIRLINAFMTETRETMKFIKENMRRKRSVDTGPL